MSVDFTLEKCLDRKNNFKTSVKYTDRVLTFILQVNLGYWLTL